jgi:L-seryl-tRNA(Ser) seleniumtransferase
VKSIPAMHRVLSDERVAPYEILLGRNVIKRAAEEVFDRARASGEGAYDALVDELASRLDALHREALCLVINATGIILHTNLGRAPVAIDALHEVMGVASGYSNLEYDLKRGERSSRYSHVSGLVNEVTGAEDSLVVNNCAAAVLLALDTFARGREVVVARNQLVEIGGGFRVPDVLERSGATLVEVGTTNRVYIEDFERALSPRTALLLRTHPSNYRIEGFTHDATARELVVLGRRAGVIVAEDLGSGAVVDLAEFGIAHERTVQDALGDGVGLVTFSGDKLLGGPQAGIIAGRAHLIAPMKNNHLLRALRVGKMTLAALGGTLQRYRDGSFRERLPIFRMLAATVEELRERSRA